MNRSTINRNLGKKKPVNLFKYDVAIIVMAILYAFAEFYNTMLPLKFSIALILGMIIIAAIGLLVNKRWAKIISIILIIGMIFAQVYSQFSLDRMVAFRDTSTQTTSLVVLQNSPLQSLEDTNGKIFGKSPSVSEDMVTAVQKKMNDKIMGQLIDSEDDLSLAYKLYNNEIEVMILNEATRGTILEVYPDFETNTRILEEVHIEIPKVEVKKPVNTTSETFTILISGIDTEGPVSSVSRSDVNILMTINPNTHKILTVSIPRDTYIPISCFNNNYDKLTHSGIRGVDCTLTSLENFLDIDINYYARVNFTSVINILNVVGPIDVYSHYSFTTNNGQYSFVKGINTMNADQALLFSRERYNLPNGDIGRGIHQQEVIKATFAKIVSSISLFNIEALINQVNKSVDTNFGSSELSALVNKQLNENPSWEFDTFAIIGAGDSKTTYLYPNQQLYVMHPDMTMVKEAVDKINAMK